VPEDLAGLLILKEGILLMFDIIIENGRVVDGTGNPWFRADVALNDGKIAAVGRFPGAEAAQRIDAAQGIVCPGFIDTHSHSDLNHLINPGAEPKVMQGVTTENLGLDGLSVAPIKTDDVPHWRRHLAGLAGDPDIEWTWGSFSDYLDALDSCRVATNNSSYVGLGTIRLMVMGMDDRPATEAEIREMQRIAARCMEEGARGISAGLIYPPSRYQTLDEMVAIAETVQAYEGIYDVHMRTESDQIHEAIDEVLTIGRRSGIPVQITHFKVRGRRNWGRSGELIAMLDQARTQGIDVTMAQYPYTAGSTILHATIPPWYHTQGAQGLLTALKEQREEIKRDIRERMDWENFAGILGWDKIFVSSVVSAANRDCEGRTIPQIAEARGLADPADAACDLLIEEELAVGMISFGLSEEDVVTIMQHPSVSFITDSLLGGGKPHPRTYGTYPRILGSYVREQQVLRLEEAIRKMTSLPAQNLRLRTKGVLAAGYDADLVVFDPAAIAETATYEEPRQYPAGIGWVLVNGIPVVAEGSHTGERPGRAVRTR